MEDHETRRKVIRQWPFDEVDGFRKIAAALRELRRRCPSARQKRSRGAHYGCERMRLITALVPACPGADLATNRPRLSILSKRG
jgi:hypothetical protein